MRSVEIGSAAAHDVESINRVIVTAKSSWDYERRGVFFRRAIRGGEP